MSLGNLLADIGDAQLKNHGAAMEGVEDSMLRLALPQGVSIVVNVLREKLAATTVPAERMDGSPYEVTLLRLFQELFGSPVED